MKLKYYLRGLGMGIIVTALILRLMPGNSGKMTDAEVRARAAELGMTDSSDLVPLGDIRLQEDGKKENAGASENRVSQNQMSGNNAGKSPVSGNTVSSDTVPENSLSGNQTSKSGTFMPEVGTLLDEAEDGQALTKSSGATQLDTEVSGNASAQPAADPAGNASAQPVTADEFATITITAGQSSPSAANACKSAGLVEDASAFDHFLCDGGYDRRLKAGSYTIRKGTSFEEIARALTGNRQ